MQYVIGYFEIGAVVAFVALVGHLIWDKVKPPFWRCVWASVGVAVLWPIAVVGYVIAGLKRFAEYMARS